MPQPSSIIRAKADGPGVTKDNYLSLASFLEGNVRNPFARKKNPQGEALREAGERYGRLDFVAAYMCFKPAHEKAVSDMQRVLARNVEFEANKLAKSQQKPLAAAKETVQRMRMHAQQVIDQFDSLLADLEGKRQVQALLARGEGRGARGEAEITPPGATADSAQQCEAGTRVPLPSKSAVAPPDEIVSGEGRYRKAPYSPPEKGALYAVRDKAKGERIIRIIGVSPDGAQIQVEVLENGEPSKQPIQLAVESLARQAAKGWCSLLLPVTEQEEVSVAAHQPAASDITANVNMRLDSQNFGRCCADIVRANIRFDIQLIKDVADGPFRAGNYEQAFLRFEQSAVGFSSAVANSRQAIASGRRALTAEKGKLSGKEIQDRNAAFVRSEHLIHTAEREFSTILEGLRMFMRAEQDSAKAGL